MDFTVTDLHKMEKNLRSSMDQILHATKAQSVEALNHSVLMKMNKDTLANFVENISKLLIGNIDLCKSAAGTVDQLKSEQLTIQNQVIDLQREQLSSVQKTVQTEMQTWSDVVRKNCENNTPSLKKMKKVVESAVQDDERSRNFIIHGVPENRYDAESELAEELINEIWQYNGSPDVIAANKIGAKKGDDGRPRPIKVTLAYRESVKMVLARAHKLKKSAATEYHTWFITPDRNREEQAAHNKLVAQLKEKITADSTRYHYIKDGKILSVDKK